MTKARARERAKARAAAKAANPAPKSAKHDDKVRPTKADAQAGTIRKYSAGAPAFASPVRRGSARSK